MLKSITQLKTSRDNNKYYATYLVEDDNFREEITVIFGGSKSFGRTRAVIEVYNKRDLSVVGNIIFLFKLNEEEFGLTVEDQIIQNKEYNKEYFPYNNQVEEELNNYLSHCINRFPPIYKNEAKKWEAAISASNF